jgi:hypothetical protein
LADHVISKDFSETLRKLETFDPGHAGTFNPLFERLINNDAHLKEKHAAHLADYVSTSNPPPPLLPCDKTGATDSTANLQAIVNNFPKVIIDGIVKFSTVYVDIRGAIICGKGMEASSVWGIDGGKGFVVRNSKQTIRDIGFTPEGNINGIQSDIHFDCITIQSLSGNSAYIEWLNIERCYFENYKGAAIKNISPLRESVITKCRIDGMGDVVNNISPLHLIARDEDGTIINNITINDNTIYRFSTPAIYCGIEGVVSNTRSTQHFNNIKVKDNLIHGQLLDITQRPDGFTVYPELTNHCEFHSVSGLKFTGNKVTAIHPDKIGILVKPNGNLVNNGQVNEAIVIDSKNEFSYSSLIVPSFTGEYIHIEDSRGVVVCSNTLYAGMLSNEIKIIDTNTYAFNSKAKVYCNIASNGAPIKIEVLTDAYFIENDNSVYASKIFINTKDTDLIDNNSGSEADDGFVVDDEKCDICRYNGPALRLGRTGSDGAISSFNKSGNQVGTIDVIGSGIRFASDSANYTVCPIKLGAYYLWIDSTGKLRIKNGLPTSDTDGQYFAFGT